MEGISRDAKMVTRETLGWIEVGATKSRRKGTPSFIAHCTVCMSQAVTGRRFSPEAFRENLEDGVALCE